MGFIYEKKQVEQVTIAGFGCSKCGRQFDSEDIVEMQEALFHSDTGGYGSIWGDGNTYHITLCQDCAFELLGAYAEFEDDTA